jgi:hypothetical protein
MKKQLPLFFLLVSHWAFAQTEAPPFQVSEFSVWSQRVDLSAYVGKKISTPGGHSCRAKKPGSLCYCLYPKRVSGGWTSGLDLYGQYGGPPSS